MKKKILSPIVLCLALGPFFSLPSAIMNAAPNTKGVQIDAEFPGGNIILENIEGDTVTLRQDRRDTEGWWFYWYFRVSGAAGRTVTFNFADNHERHGTIGLRGPAVSMDEGAQWQWLGRQPSSTSFTYTFPTSERPVRFSFGMPYTEANLKAFLHRVGTNSQLRRSVLCHSRKGRPVERLHVGAIDGTPRFRVVVACRSHSCEMMASYALEGMISAALANDADGNWFRQHVELLAVPFVDKDGVEDGDQGKNRRPRDHNRDYEPDGLYPETRAIQDFVPKWSEGRLRIALDLHCPNINEEVIYLVGNKDPAFWQEEQRFGRIVAQEQTGSLIYRTADNLPFGKGWNTGNNYKAGTPFSRWASGLHGVQLATTIELPYASASGHEVNADTAREFGRRLARAIRAYLDN